VDGTAKPEIEPVIRFSKFFAANRNLMVGKRDEEVVMVIPHSQMWSTRNNATEATRRCVRAMSYHCMITMNAVSEYRIHTLTTVPKLIVVPAPRTLQEKAWNSLLALVEQGSTLLITGVFDDDEHWIPRDRLKKLGIEASVRPVAQHEILVIDGKEYELNYRGEKIQRIEKAVVRNNSSGNIFTFSYGRGAIIWSPLPVELAEDIDPTAALYTNVLKQAKCSPVFTIEKINPSVLILPLIFDETALYTFVSECDRDVQVKLIHLESNTMIEVNVPAQRTAIIFLDRRDGKIISRM
ncbi:MAG TPA: hypothetical protein VFF29_00020, partial [Bacteroidota bacterium]|nr:hypothetical protein [Bacteroidota bacterium]